MTRIVRTAYRYKRPPGKRKPAALEVPAVVRELGIPSDDLVGGEWLHERRRRDTRR